MILYDVHTVAAPVRHYQQYQDLALAQRMRDHLAAVLGTPLVVEPVEEPVPTTVYRIDATRRKKSIVAGRCDPEDLEQAMAMWQQALPGWRLCATPEVFTGPATEAPADPGR